MLAYLEKDKETDCEGFLVHVDWGEKKGPVHPHTYNIADVTVERYLTPKNND